MSTHNPKVVEAVAVAIYDTAPSTDISYRSESGWVTHSWGEMPEFYKDMVRKKARAALDAIDALYDETPVVGGIEGGL